MENDKCCKCLCEKVKLLQTLILNTAKCIKVGKTSILPAGEPATVSNSGTCSDVVLDFGIPSGANGVTPNIGVNGNWVIGDVDTDVHAQGVKGLAATVTVGTTTTLEAGLPATVSFTGTLSDAILHFGIPQGIQGTGSAKLEYCELRGALGNSEGSPQVVPSGSKIFVKEYKNQIGGFQVVSDPTRSYFTISKTGKYLAIFDICVSSVTPGIFNWGLYAQEKGKHMLCSANALITIAGGQHNVAGTGIFDVTDITEQYNLINNSKMQVSVQGVLDSQVVHTSFQYATAGVKDVSGLSFALIRLGDI